MATIKTGLPGTAPAITVPYGSDAAKPVVQVAKQEQAASLRKAALGK